jgi:tRNA threonylcarbamoyladenosine biosynthesis protein TsaE
MNTVLTRNESETFALGARLGRAAEPGIVVALIGELGAGKTVFARGVGEGLAVETRVSSPTFILVQTHEGGRLPYWHADFYRLTHLEDLEQLGLDEVLEGAGVTVIEWADRFPDALPVDRLEVRFDDDVEGRRITLRATGPRHEALEAILVG